MLDLTSRTAHKDGHVFNIFLYFPLGLSGCGWALELGLSNSQQVLKQTQMTRHDDTEAHATGRSGNASAYAISICVAETSKENTEWVLRDKGGGGALATRLAKFTRS